ncbi:MAG: hypothetical protein HC772_06600 [Leptolyngbyaceae cyanobacterium CRU_2_3]|nr:hypothetical protein [Leptolyngbyaceae cyanobacterium CRU_2_3]
MEPGSQASDPPERAFQSLANVMGTLIALLTLTVPIAAIAHFSSIDRPTWQSPPQTSELQN